MEIKDIKQFRKYYKEQVRRYNSPDRNENYIGVRYSNENFSEFGFFEIYHGDKEGEGGDGIRGFLEGFLDMARDGQAIYEFLQNAVDANSSRFSLFWDKEPDSEESYLLVVNNGYQFDFKSIRSILNVGVSTKTPEQHTIGKFGIGFKLAHRLVGKENGLHELINKNYGPILFSWRNGEFFNFFIDKKIDPVKQVFKKVSENEHICETDTPWLFKILLTNFPCQPEEEILDFYHKPSIGFSLAEVEKMQSWIKRYIHHFSVDDYQEGSLFFIRLGEGKLEHLKEAELSEGLRFSMSILNETASTSVRGIDKMNINGKEIERVDLRFLKFTIRKDFDNEVFNWIKYGKKNELTEDELKAKDKDIDIEILMGYTDYSNADKILKNAPNFYLYFPLSAEKHRIKFILHSNAFYKSSSRTSLHTGTDETFSKNERILSVFSKKLIEHLDKLKNCDQNENLQEFLDIYAIILISEKSEYDVWINKPLLDSLFEYLENNIPIWSKTRLFETSSDISKIKIKNTTLPIQKFDWIPYYFFYWSNNPLLLNQAKEKLKIEDFTILDILEFENSYLSINELIYSGCQITATILDELNLHIQNVKTSDTILDNIYNLKVFEFQDDKFFSINELILEENWEYLINFDKISSLKDYLEKAGFIISKTDLSKYTALQTFIRNRQKVKYISNYVYLNTLLSRKFINFDFSIDEKIKIFGIIEKLADDQSAEERNKRMQVLKLFKNRTGSVVAIENLCDYELSDYFLPYRIETLPDDFENINRYIVRSKKEFYDRVIFPLWDIIISTSYTQILSNPSGFYNEVVNYFQLSSREKYLSGKNTILVKNEFVADSAYLLYHAALKNLTSDNYSSLCTAFTKMFNYILPEFSILPFLNQAPFSINNFDFNVLWLETEFEVTEKEITAIGKAFQEVGFKIFERFIIQERNSKLFIRPKKVNELQVWISAEEKALDYLINYHKELIPLPDLPVFKDTVEYHGQKLFKFFISKLNFSNETQVKELIDIIKTKDKQLSSYLLELIPEVHINLNEELWHVNVYPVIDLVCRMDDLTSLGTFQSKTKITSGDRTFILSSLTHGVGENTIYLGLNKEYKITLSEIFTDDQINDAAIIERIVQKIQSEGINDYAKLKKVFNISHEIKNENILTEINRWHQENGYLKNASHLAFILIYSLNHEIKPNEYRVYIDGKQVELDGRFACSEKDFPLFKQNTYLKDKYDSIKDILNLTSRNPAFRSNNIEIYLKPEIVESNLKCPEIKELDDKECLLLLDILLDQQYIPQKIYFDQEWSSVLGFNPSYKVAYKHRIDEETLPNHIFRWYCHDKEMDPGLYKRKIRLLSSLGIKFGFDSICDLRSLLLDGYSEKEIAIEEVDKIELKLLENSIELLHLRLGNYQIIHGDRNFNIIRKIFQRLLNENLIEIPLPVLSNHQGCYYLSKLESFDYYLDHESINYLKQYGLSKWDAASKIKVRIYDATDWFENNLLKERLNKIEIIEVIDREKIQEYSVTWDKYFYAAFKSYQPLVVIKQIDKIPLQLFLGESFVGEYEKQSIIKYDGIIYVTNQFSDSEILSRVEEEGLIKIEELNDLKKEFHQYKSRIAELFDSNSPTGKLFRDKLDEIRKEAEIQSTKETIKENLGRNKYSYGWFKNFIEIQILQGKSADNYSPEHDIDFYKIGRDAESDRLILLSDPNRTITPTIEYCADFHATLFKTGGGSIEISFQGVSKKGQVLWGQLSNPNELQNIDLSQIKRVKLHFSREIDLLNRLLNAFKRLGSNNKWDERFCLKENLTENVKFYFGPPGTGKTTKVAEEIIKKMENGDELKILVLTPTNKSADVLSEKILTYSNCQCSWLIRYGACFSSNIIELGYHYDANTIELDRFKRFVLITTIHRYPYEEVTISEVSGEKKRLCDIPWDIIFFDEASMIPVTYSVFTVYQNESIDSKSAEYIFAGDPLQIPPVIDISDEEVPDDFNKEENIYSLIGLDSFLPDEQKKIPKYGNKILNLNKQFRSIRLIGELFSYFSYNHLITHARDEGIGRNRDPKPVPENFRKIVTNPVQLIRFPVNDEDSIYKPNKLRLSPYHFHSAILTMEIVRYFNNEINENEVWSIGIICPYKSQATLVNKMIESLKLKINLSVVTDTVHGFQGDECDIVFFLLSPSSPRITTNPRLFLHKHYLINVAISRAKDYLVILYPDKESEGIENLYKIHQTHQNSVESILIKRLGQNISKITLHSTDIENYLFKDPYYIQNNIFTNQHQLINVYGKAEKKYMVKESTTAIDVQMRYEIEPNDIGTI
jgi:hypothetical protein